MKKQTHLTSSSRSIICPECGIHPLDCSAQGVARCTRCDRSIDAHMFKTLEQIAGLPDAVGSHSCECGYPQMRRLPDGVLWCPSCGSEILPLSAPAVHAQSGSTSEAYQTGWADGLFETSESFIHNPALARWKEAHDRLEYYRGHRAGRAARF